MQLGEPLRDYQSWLQSVDAVAIKLFGKANENTRQLVPVIFGRPIGRDTDAVRAMLKIIRLDPNWRVTDPFDTIMPGQIFPYRENQGAAYIHKYTNEVL
jgi:hypothetical protein